MIAGGDGSAMAVERVAVARLRPYRGNARTHSSKQIRQIADSIRKFGFTNPVLIGEDEEIIAGHGRVEAARLLGMESVPAVRLPHLDAAQRRAYCLADNKLALNSGWDRELLASELRALVDFDLDVEITGFSLAEVELVGDDAREPGPEPGNADDEVSPRTAPAATVTRSDDVWLVDWHQVLCDDPGSAAAFDRLIQGQRTRLVFAHPADCDRFVRRFEQVTGRRARLAVTGQSFADVAAARGLPSTLCEEKLP